MALNTNVMMADGGGSGKKPEKDYSGLAAQAAMEDAREAWLASIRKPADDKPVDTPSTSTPARSSSGGGTAAVSAVSAPVAEIPVASKPTYAGTYDRQIAELAAQIAGRGAFQAPGTYDEQIADLYARINGREEFNYDLNGDAFWKMYSDKYTQAAKDAMRDTMGQAAALTGGYGSSYGQAVGQQAYDRRMSELMDIAPELYQMAYQRYQDEGDDLLQKLGLASQMADDEYGKAYQQHTDEGDALLQRLSVARQLANDEYSRYQDDYERQSKERQNNLAFLQSMIALGYTPTAQEIADAGLTSAQYQAIAAQYAPKSSGGGSSKKTEESSTTPSAYEMGVDIGKTYGASAATVFQKADQSGLTEKEKRQIYQGIVDSQHLAYLDK